MARDDHTVRRLWGAALLALVLGAGAQGCDRCAGVLGCTGEPRLSLTGQLIVRETGAAVPGAAVDFVRTGGVSLASDSISTTTDGAGRFQLAVGASALGQVVGDLVVRPPAPWHAYRARGVSYPTSDVRGQGQVLGQLVVTPYVAFLGVLSNRADGRPLSGARVTIVRTGGVELTASDSFDIAADTTGYFFFDVAAQDAGALTTDMIVHAPALPQASRRSGVVFTAQYQDRLTQVGGAWTLGTWLPWVGVLVHRGSESRSAGIEIDFQRTGGIPVRPDTFVVHTNQDGAFALSPTPLAQGAVVANLIVRPPAPEPAETIFAQSLATADTDQQVILGVWGYGYGIADSITLRLRGNGQPAPAGLRVQFVRRGGIAVTPDSALSQTDDSGRFRLLLDASGPGDVIGDVTVGLPPPFGPDTLRGVRIASFASDEIRVVAGWGVGPSLQYAGQLVRSDNGAPVAGAEADFQRTGGIAVAPSLLVGRSDTAGVFLLNPAPLDTGVVLGNLTIHPPAPFRDTTFTGIRLHTFDNDSLRLAGVFRIAPPQ